jgi:hypothetical protein
MQNSGINPRDRRCRPKRASLVPARGLTREKVRGLLWEYESDKKLKAKETHGGCSYPMVGVHIP